NKEYDVPVVLSPQKDAVVRATVKRQNDTEFRDYQTIPISYNSLP
ncbi:serine/threonine-protein kinase, partial [Citrobacter freundii ATCC 8090 = MTCC 1658 = NBRC 12681]